MTMFGCFRFGFELDGVLSIAPWGEGEDRKLHWFGLTSGHYWLNTPIGEALRYTELQRKSWGLPSPYVDYQVARLFEDLHSILPFALETVPADIAALSSDPIWQARSVEWANAGEEKDDRWELWSAANEWWNDRHIDTAYLVDGPDFHFWRIADKVVVRWRQRSGPSGVWETPNGEFVIEAAAFQAAAHEFLDEVTAQMEERVSNIARCGWDRADCTLDIDALVREQEQRTAWVEEVKIRQVNTDWDSTRVALDFLRQEMHLG